MPCIRDKCILCSHIIEANPIYVICLHIPKNTVTYNSYMLVAPVCYKDCSRTFQYTQLSEDDKHNAIIIRARASDKFILAKEYEYFARKIIYRETCMRITYLSRHTSEKCVKRCLYDIGEIINTKHPAIVKFHDYEPYAADSESRLTISQTMYLFAYSPIVIYMSINELHSFLYEHCCIDIEPFIRVINHLGDRFTFRIDTSYLKK